MYWSSVSSGNGLVGGVHEVQVVGGVLVVQEDEAGLHVADGSGLLSGSIAAFGGRGGAGTAACEQAQAQRQDQGNVSFSFFM